jgi:hypothetical protein
LAKYGNGVLHVAFSERKENANKIVLAFALPKLKADLAPRTFKSLD